MPIAYDYVQWIINSNNRVSFEYFGHVLSISIEFIIGAAIGVATGDMVFWMVLGLVIGAGLGAAID